jgi:hypothetical protein
VKYVLFLFDFLILVILSGKFQKDFVVNLKLIISLQEKEKITKFDSIILIELKTKN